MSPIESRHGTWHGRDYWFLSATNQPLIFYAPEFRVALALNSNKIPASATLPSRITERLESSTPLEPIAPPVTAFHLGVGLTRDCSLACTYCHADAGQHQRTTWETVNNAITYAITRAAQTPKRLLSASFAVGGEPTLEWDLFTATVTALREGAKALDGLFLSMTTNGYYGDEKRKFVADNFDIVTVSLDGPPSIQDAQRPTRGGRPSYDVVADTIRALIAARRVRVALRATVSAKSVDNLPHIVEHFVEQFGQAIAISFEPLVKIGRAIRNEDAAVPDLESYTTRFLEARNVGRRLGVHVSSSGASLSRLVKRFCGAMSIPSFAVCIDGSVTSCHRDQNATDYRYGQIRADGTVTVDEARLAYLATLNDMPGECNSCFAKWHCAGDCPDLRRIGWSRCEFNRALVYDDITGVLARQKGGDDHA